MSGKAKKALLVPLASMELTAEQVGSMREVLESRLPNHLVIIVVGMTGNAIEVEV